MPARTRFEFRIIQAIVTCQCSRIVGRAMRLQIRGGGHRHKTHIAQFATDQRRVGQLTDAQRDIKPLLNRINLLAGHPHIELYCRMRLLKTRDQGPHRRHHQGLRQRDPQRALRLFACRRRGCSRLLGDVLEVFAVFMKTFARLGQAQPVRRAIHQLHAELLFQHGNVTTHHRL